VSSAADRSSHIYCCVKLIDHNPPAGVTNLLTMATEMQAFAYQELEGAQTFRLLELLPGNRDDPIHCTMRHAKLTNRPEFYALSYC
jgi:hypothetical protein